VDKRIKPWVNKKIFEYIGEEEQTLVEFICSKVSYHFHINKTKTFISYPFYSSYD